MLAAKPFFQVATTPVASGMSAQVLVGPLAFANRTATHARPPVPPLPGLPFSRNRRTRQREAAKPHFVAKTWRSICRHSPAAAARWLPAAAAALRALISCAHARRGETVGGQKAPKLDLPAGRARRALRRRLRRGHRAHIIFLQLRSRPVGAYRRPAARAPAVSPFAHGFPQVNSRRLDRERDRMHRPFGHNRSE
eukprot:COSAG06_NODE_2861_length_6161_cov_22.755856_2_plen_195_part_00